MDDTRKSQVEKRIFAGLLVVFGVGLVSMLKSFWHPPVRLPAATRAAQAGPPVVQTPTRLPQAATPATSEVGDRPAIGYTAGELRDPLVSLLPKPKVESLAADGSAETRAAETPVAPAVRVEGMFWGGSRPQVLIDGQLYDVGDTVGGSQIVAITREGVTVVKQGATFVLQPPVVADAGAEQPHGSTSSRPFTRTTPVMIEQGR